MSSKRDYNIIVIGAGVVGPCIATALARQGRKVLIVERDWSEPNRIVGELMQPSGLKALRELGMIEAINDIDAFYTAGYLVKNYNEDVLIPYSYKQDLKLVEEPVPGCVKNGNDKLKDDKDTEAGISVKDWDSDERIRGVAFHHGRFVMNLRKIATQEPNITKLQRNVTSLLKDELDACIGVEVEDESKNRKNYSAELVICTDGIYSKFRKELFLSKKPQVGSYFVGLELNNAVVPKLHYGHVIMGDHAPILMYQISQTKTRVLCAYRSEKLPPKNDVLKYLNEVVLPSFPAETQPSLIEALSKDDCYRAMPNQYLTAKTNTIPGLAFIGDALNMRHPLTGGGMTVGINDAALLARVLYDVSDLLDDAAVSEKLAEFHYERKKLSSVINVLSIALFSLFDGDSKALLILRKGCFAYFKRGGKCVTDPVDLLSGLLPSPMILFHHFFSVAFYGLWLNYVDRGLIGFPLAIWENLCALYTAIIVFTPYLWDELVV
ncbi:BA75_00115T0 [Komagataella pastoris]|uniref:Squalene monooxygenase n=1 Tax=Komagataella pastoris TaxID=4922 RepID=A0A1B2J8B6_PICPA|nr:BA75_00115T0 [Komagataella pastoris]